MKILFMGTPDIAAVVLKGLIDDKAEIVAVVTQPDRPKGRGKGVAMSPVKEVALAHDIPVLQPERIRSAENVAQLRQYPADLFVVVAFGQILTQEILDIPRLGCVNVHASLLPKYRGASPIQWVIADGLDKTGVTIMQMDAGIDTGDMLTSVEVDITAEDTGETLRDKLAEAGAKLLIDTLPLIESGSIEPIQQDDSQASYVGMLKKEMGALDYTRSAVELERLIRAFTPWPGTFTKMNGKLMKVKKAQVLDKTYSDCRVGSVVEVRSDAIVVACREGALMITEIQPEGKRAMSVHDYLLGAKVESGVILGE